MIHTFDNSMFGHERIPSFAHYGVKVEDASDIEEVLQKSDTNYTVGLEQLFLAKPHPTNPFMKSAQFEEFTGRYATVATWPDGRRAMFEAVSGIYQPFQNRQGFQLCQDLVDSGDAQFSAAGSMRGGRSVFVAMKLPDHILVGGVDPIDKFLLFWNSHDGSSGIRGCITNVRLFCTNQLPGLFRRIRDGKNTKVRDSFNIRHTTNAGQRLQAVRDILALTFKYEAAVEEEFERMLDTTMTNSRFDAIVEQLLPFPQDDDSEDCLKVLDERDRLSRLFVGSNLANVAGTNYAAYQAAVEYADWYVPVKGRDQLAARAKTQLTGRYDDFKARAFELTRVVAA